SMSRIFLYGASGHAKVIIEILEGIGMPVGALQDVNPAIKSLLAYEVSTQLPEVFDPLRDSVIISIGNNAIRKKLAATLDHSFFTAIHPSARISKRATIGEGTVVM